MITIGRSSTDKSKNLKKKEKLKTSQGHKLRNVINKHFQYIQL